MTITPTITSEARVPETTVDAPPARPDTRAWLGERISTEAAVLMGATWYVLFMIGSTLEPRAAEPTPAWATALSLVFLSSLAVTAAGLLARRRWGLLASLAGAGIFMAFSIACPVSGHHAFAAWWFGQLACAVALVGASVFALRRA
jgi:hypothetical protein